MKTQNYKEKFRKKINRNFKYWIVKDCKFDFKMLNFILIFIRWKYCFAKIIKRKYAGQKFENCFSKLRINRNEKSSKHRSNESDHHFHPQYHLWKGLSRPFRNVQLSPGVVRRLEYFHEPVNLGLNKSPR